MFHQDFVSMLLRKFSSCVRPAWLVAAAFLLLPAASLRADHPGEKNDGEATTLGWTFESSHSALSSRETDFYVRIRIKAAKAQTESRQPLTLALVFDRSGSMDSEDKIGYLRKAGHVVADNLTRNDHVALIAFNHQVQTLVPLHRVVNREYLHHRIDELHAEGYTNISGGLMDGCAEVKKRMNEAGLHHVILLTDGIANRGVWQPDALVELTKRLTSSGITVTTIGVGTEYNETLLARMAQAGGGRYVYVAKPEDIPMAFKQELGDLLAVVAQNVKLKMKLPPGLEVRQIFGWEATQKPGRFELSLGDFTSGEDRTVLVKMRFTANNAEDAGRSLDLQATLTFDDVAGADRRESQQAVVIGRSNGAGQSTPVLAYAQLVEAVDKIAVAVSSMDRKAAAEVIAIRRNEYPALKQAAFDSRDQDFVNKSFLFEHYARELQELIDAGALHEHSQERAKLQKELHYRRFLMKHHQHQHRH